MGDATTTFKDAGGRTYEVPADQLGGALAAGLTPESGDQRTDRLASDVKHETYGGVAGGVLATTAGIARGATLGASDYLVDAAGGQQALSGLRDENPNLSTAGQIGGSIMLGELGGINAGIGERVAGIAEGGGLSGRVIANTLQSAAEGSLQNAGAYISDTALGDRSLSADGFVGAMSDGALWGGVAGGALTLTSSGLTAARRLFPAADMTAEGATAARSAATSSIKSAVDDSEQLSTIAQGKLNNLADQEAIVNPSFKQQRDMIRLKAAQDVADQQVAAATADSEARQAISGSKSKLQAIKEEQALAKSADRGARARSKPAFDFLNDFAVPADEGNAVTAAAAGPSLLERQLQGTKQLVDQGKSISEIGQQRVNQALAQVNPDAAKLTEALSAVQDSKGDVSAWLDKYGAGSDVGKFERSQATRDVADSWRNRGEGWQSKVPEGEGNIGLARGTTSEWRGSAEGRAQWEKDFEAGRTKGKAGGISSHEQSVADSAIDDISLRRMKRGGLPSTSGDDIIADQSPSEHIDRALKTRSADINDDIAETAPMITKHEAAHADLTEALGPDAPAGSQQRAAAFREAQTTAQGKATAQVTNMADAASKLPSTAAGGAFGNMAATYQALQMMGVPLPDPSKIPVIGPLLSAYLKAKLLVKVAGRHGGGVAQTAETVIANKASMIRQRVYKAVDSALAGGSKVTAAAARSAGPAAILGHKLFDAGPAQMTPYSSEPAKGSLESLYLARSAEVQASQAPGAIADAVTKRVQTSDPEALAEIIATSTRQLNYIASKMPRPTDPPGVLNDRMWVPSKQDLAKWSTIVGAVNDPAGVMERASRGEASADEIAAVSSVFPALYADGQKRVIEQVSAGKGRDLTSVQKNSLSRAWGLPLSGSPGTAAWMQQSYQPAPPPMQPAGVPGQSTLSGPITLGQRTLTRLDGG